METVHVEQLKQLYKFCDQHWLSTFDRAFSKSRIEEHMWWFIQLQEPDYGNFGYALSNSMLPTANLAPYICNINSQLHAVEACNECRQLAMNKL